MNTEAVCLSDCRGGRRAPCSPCPPRFLRAETLRFSRTAQSARPVRRDCAMIGPQFRTGAPVWRRPICWMSRSWLDRGLFLRNCKTIGGDWLPTVENCGKSSLATLLALWATHMALITRSVILYEDDAG